MVQPLPPPGGENLQSPEAIQNFFHPPVSPQPHRLIQNILRQCFGHPPFVQGRLHFPAPDQHQGQAFPHRPAGIFQQFQGVFPARQQDFHGFPVIFPLPVPGNGLFDPTVFPDLQNPPGGLGAAQFQLTLLKISVIVGNSGKFPAGSAQGVMAQLRLNGAQPILPPHGAPLILQLQNRLSVPVCQGFSQPVSQFSRKAPVKFRSGLLHLNFPFMAAAVRAFSRQALKCFKIIRLSDLHILSPSYYAA